MATPSQLAANRQNATRSTGPRTDAGKTISSRNALKSGLYAKSLIIRGEDPADLEALRAEYVEEYNPQTPTERDLVDTLVHTEWIRRRIRYVEACAWNDYLARDRACYERENMEYDEDFAFGRIYEYAGDRLEGIRRRLNGLDRTYHTVLADLRKLQAERARAAQPATPPRKPARSAADPKPLIGFVSSPVPELTPLPLERATQVAAPAANSALKWSLSPHAARL